MRRIPALLVALIGVLSSSRLLAQVRMTQQGSARPVSIAFGGGASVPVGSYKDALKAGWNGQGSLIYNVAGLPLALRADLNYNQFTFKEDLPFAPGGSGRAVTTSDDITQQILGGLANVTIPFRMGPITPYITAGLAGFNIRTKLGGGTGATDQSDTKFAVNGGAGLSLRLLGASAFIEARLNNVYTDQKLISNKELKDLQFIPITFGFVF